MIDAGEADRETVGAGGGGGGGGVDDVCSTKTQSPLPALLLPVGVNWRVPVLVKGEPVIVI